MDPNLFLILLHELGHVFGVPHVGAMGSLMSAEFPELIANSKPFLIKVPLERWSEAMSQFFLVNSSHGSDFNPEAKGFFGLKDKQYQLSFKIESKEKRILIESTPDLKELHPVGYLENIRLKVNKIEPGSVVVLNPKQKVLKSKPITFDISTGEPGPTFIYSSGTATFKSPSGISKEVNLKLGPKLVEIVGEVDKSPLQLVPRILFP